jgi:hypothetical protein
MRHGKVKRMVSEFIDGELPAEKIKFIRLHIEGCKECKNFVKSSRLIRNFIQEDKFYISPYLISRIEARLSETARTESIWNYIVEYAKELVFVLVLIFILLMGFVLFSGRDYMTIEDIILSEFSAYRSTEKIINMDDELSQDEILELTLSNGEER